jgi:hypothetical protein
MPSMRDIPHFPFFAALANLPEESPEFLRLIAGLRVLRLLDHSAGNTDVIDAAIDHVRPYLTSLSPHEPTRAILLQALDAIMVCPTEQTGYELIANTLLSYATLMDSLNQSTIADDIRHTAVQYLTSTNSR